MIFLGCDGGSTKTEWLLVDEGGKVLSHRVFDGCNYAFLGDEGFANLMRASISQVLQDGGISSADVTSAMLGLTVYGEIPGTEERIPAILRESLPDCPVTVESDSAVGWSGSLACRPGINVVAGTGSIAYGRDESGKTCRVGGWSLFFADEGSCSWVARELIGEFVKQADGRHPRTALYDALRQTLHLTHNPYFSGYLQTEIRKDSSLLAKLQPVALRAAQQGDETALAIYRRAAEELLEMAEAIRRQLRFSRETPVPVSYSGGLFHAGAIILDPLQACMSQAGFQLTRPRYTPVLGAVALAAESYRTRRELDTLLEAAAQGVAAESAAVKTV